MSAPDLTLLRPLWLLALPGLALLGWWLWARAGSFGVWSRAANPVLMQAMAALGRIDGAGERAGRWPLIALLAVAALCVLALSGPAVERRDAQSFRNLDGVIFLVDASPSVTEAAEWPQVLTMGRFGIGALGARPGAIIVYAGDAYVATDMTGDHRQLGQTLSLIDAETVPDRGSRPERALALAGQVLDEAQVIAGDVVLFTDGGGLGPETLQQAEALRARGARLSLVPVGAQNPAMDTHASAGGGQVFAATAPEALTRWLSDNAPTRLAQADYPILFWRDMGRWVLVLALIPLLFLFRRRAA